MTVRLGQPLDFDQIVAVARGGEKVEIDRSAVERVDAARRVVEEAVVADAPVYGITTGIGHLANVRIAPSEAIDLQRDIVRSHATAVGPALRTEVVRAMMLLKARTFAFGVSGVRVELIERMVAMLNSGIHPIVPAQGSLGASGDLALLAHLALPIMGEGMVERDGQTEPARAALATSGIEPLELSYKEGLSLVNGTEGMLALGILTIVGAEQLARVADVSGAMSLEACLGTDRAFAARLISLREHRGSEIVAANLRALLEGSEIVASHRDSYHLVQDAYSLRCIPQVHGAYRDGAAYVRSVLEAELASAVDNPSVLRDEGQVLSSGNFHGESLGLALDHLCVCGAGFATISERRTARLVDPHMSNGLPAFLTNDPGRSSGFMLAQYTAASLVSENRSLCWPASVDSIPTSAGQEDHVSMGMTSARRAEAVLDNSFKVLAIEALVAAQGLDLRRPLAPAAATVAARAVLRDLSSGLEEDRPLSSDIETVTRLMSEGGFVRAAESVAGHLS
jgi:histidine ammonia-lyase